jgi:hypothetical protein
MRKWGTQRVGGLYKLKTGRMMNGPRMHDSVLWASHLDWGWLLGLPYSNIYAQPYPKFQAVVETITNEVAKALNILAKQSTKMCNAH